MFLMVLNDFENTVIGRRMSWVASIVTGGGVGGNI